MVYGALSILVITLVPGRRGRPHQAADRRRWRIRDLREDPKRPSRRSRRRNRADAPVDGGRASGAVPLSDRIEPEDGDAGTDAIVECRGIEFSYGTGLKVLRNVDLAVKRGHIHGLIGPNGSGKSTLANVIAGGLRPIAGTILVKGVRVDGVAPSGRAALGMRRTFQAAELVRELTASQNVGVGLFERVPRIVERAAFWPLLALRAARRGLDQQPGEKRPWTGRRGRMDGKRRSATCLTASNN